MPHLYTVRMLLKRRGTAARSRQMIQPLTTGVEITVQGYTPGSKIEAANVEFTIYDEHTRKHVTVSVPAFNAAQAAFSVLNQLDELGMQELLEHLRPVYRRGPELPTEEVVVATA